MLTITTNNIYDIGQYTNRVKEIYELCVTRTVNFPVTSQVNFSKFDINIRYVIMLFDKFNNNDKNILVNGII